MITIYVVKWGLGPTLMHMTVGNHKNFQLCVSFYTVVAASGEMLVGIRPFVAACLLLLTVLLL